MKKRTTITITFLIIILVVITVTYMANNTTSNSQLYGYEIINIYPHDVNAFTQGLVYENGVLYEGTGQRGYSSLRKVEIETGKVLQIYHLPDYFFGEGITIWKDKIVQLTYQSRQGIVYDKETFKPLSEFKYNTEGWGLTHNGKNLIMSDGSPTLIFLDPNSYEVVNKVAVYYNGSLLENINELEYINGKIFANVWMTDNIVIIDPESGQVESLIDLGGLMKKMQINRQIDVLNGIAYDAKNKRLFVTGKWWPNLFEIKLIPRKTD